MYITQIVPPKYNTKWNKEPSRNQRGRIRRPVADINQHGIRRVLLKPLNRDPILSILKASQDLASLCDKETSPPNHQTKDIIKSDFADCLKLRQKL